MTEGPADATADEVVDALVAFAQAVHHAIGVVAQRHDLTAQQVGLLRLLDAPVSMRAFAEELACDPSNVTGLVDRVERLGLVERVPDPRDRRVRMLTLTSKGREVRARVNGELARALSDSLGLDPDDATVVLGALGRVVPARRETP